MLMDGQMMTLMVCRDVTERLTLEQELLHVARHAQAEVLIDLPPDDAGVGNQGARRTDATFELSNQYDHAWLNGNNEYVMNDDPNFNPNGQLNGNWTSLQPVRPQP